MPFQRLALQRADRGAVEAARDLAKWHDLTAQHSLRVVKYAVGLARALGHEKQARDIGHASLLHDVGKLTLPVEILNKPDRLTDAEWALMREHPRVGAELVLNRGYSPVIAGMIQSHHERWDGNGYPDKLVGEEIPLGARIISVADVFDALTTPRSYRPAMSVAQALDVMDRERGTVLDARVFDVFREWLEAGLKLLAA